MSPCTHNRVHPRDHPAPPSAPVIIAMWKFLQPDAPGAAPFLLTLRRLFAILTVILIDPLSSSVFSALVSSSANPVSLGAGSSTTSLRISFTVFSSPSGTPFSCERLYRASLVSTSCFSHSGLCPFELCCFLRLHSHLIFDTFHHKFHSRFLQLSLSCRNSQVASIWVFAPLGMLSHGIDFACASPSPVLRGFGAFLWCRPQLAVGSATPSCSQVIAESTASARFCTNSLSTRFSCALEAHCSVGPAGCAASVTTSVVASHLKGCCGRKSSRRASSYSSRISFVVPSCGSLDVFDRQFACPSSCQRLRPAMSHPPPCCCAVVHRATSSREIQRTRHPHSVCNQGRPAFRK